MGALLTIVEAAQMVRLSTTTLRRIGPKTGLKMVQISERKTVIAVADLQSWMRERERSQTSGRA